MNSDQQLYSKVEKLHSRVKRANKYRQYLLNNIHKIQKDISPEFIKNKKQIYETNVNGTKEFYTHIYVCPTGETIEIDCIIYITKKTYSLYPSGKTGSAFHFTNGSKEKNVLWQSVFAAMKEANDKCLAILNQKKKIRIKK